MFTTLCIALAALFFAAEPELDGSRIAERLGFVEHSPVASVQLDLLPDHDSANERAEQLRSSLASAGLDELEVRVELVSGERELPPSHRVSVGPFFDFEDAERAREQLGALGVDGFVRALEQVTGC